MKNFKHILIFIFLLGSRTKIKVQEFTKKIHKEIQIFDSGIAQINPDAIEIVRDSYGVPHIYASTDAEVAYGFAWAQAEDDFETMQEGYLAGNALLSKVYGLKAASADFLTQFIQSEQTVNEQFHTLDPNFIELLNGFTAFF